MKFPTTQISKRFVFLQAFKTYVHVLVVVMLFVVLKYMLLKEICEIVKVFVHPF